MLHREGIAIPRSTSTSRDLLGASFELESNPNAILENMIDALLLAIGFANRSFSTVLTRFPSCHESLVRVLRNKCENFPVVSNTVGQLQDSATIRKFEVIEI